MSSRQSYSYTVVVTNKLGLLKDLKMIYSDSQIAYGQNNTSGAQRLILGIVEVLLYPRRGSLN